MKNRLCALGAMIAFADGHALAQNTQLSAQNVVIASISANDMIAILQSVQLSAALIDDAADGTKTIEVSSGGDIVYIAMRGCQGAGAASLCELVQPFGFFNGQGVTFDQVNNFNMNASGIATAALLTDGRGVMATKIYLVGGVTHSNLTYELSVYFSDIARLLQAVQPGVIAQVSWRAEELRASNIGLDLPAVPAGEVRHVNTVGGERNGLMTDAVRATLTRHGKIEN